MANQRLKAIQEYARQVLATDHSGHGFDHIKRVAALASRLAELTPAANRFIVEAAAWLHDTYDDKLFEDPVAAKANTIAAMTKMGVTIQEQDQIVAIIDRMSYRHNLDYHESLSLEGQLVQDADRLDAIGAIGIGRTFFYGGAHDGVMYDPTIAPRTELSGDAYRNAESTVINHFYEKLLLLAEQMNTPAAKQLAQHRQQVMLTFLDEFKAEWQGKR
ncbi:HD domain-containing protein [Lacticaseibacillus brantae]|uniref:HD superfamily hydrolase n=1 Tax=Lacticaseibacillus brantae DSM 23927 TaxID=1423727 RepID=A0A0R2B4Z5_9LACO|nr:HD domain-containing protein [Lacticaseibacillus brantae]KRM71321.1 HD superfamily hydrolase [Lacticaseibacillus brantae DSM 23927]